MRVVWLMLLAACGDNVGDPELPVPLEATSGSRLQLTWIDFDGGTIWTDAVTDNQRFGAPCEFTRWADGVFRCSPRSFGSVYFRASDCTDPIGEDYGPVHQPNPETLDYATRFEDDGFIPRRYFRSTGVRVARPVNLYTPMPDGTCRQFVTAHHDTNFYVVLENSADEFARIDFEDSTKPGRFGGRYATSADGLRLPLAVRDRRLDFACDPITTGNTSAICAPAGATELFHEPTFTDATCSMLAAGEPATHARAIDAATGCPTYHTVSSNAEAAPRYARINGECLLASAEGPLYRLSAIEPAPLQRTIIKTSRRLQYIVLGDVDYQTVTRTLWDTELGLECRFDGDQRCGPVARTGSRTDLYSDSLCDAPGVALVPAGTCEAPILAADAGASYGTPVGPPITAYRRTATACVPYIPEPGIDVRDADPRNVDDRLAFELGVRR